MENSREKIWQRENFSSDSITPEELFLNRRKFMQASMIFGIGAAWPLAAHAAKLNIKYQLPEAITKEEIATSYNNFYEFSLEKEAVKAKVNSWKVDPAWKIVVDGLAETKKTFFLNDLIAFSGESVEERVYRFRCVEAWSMVVPWSGFSLASLVSKLKPKKTAKYIVFQSFGDKSIGPNMSSMPQYPWPYTEGLTIEEAMNPLAFLATGMYGKSLPKQNGAPLRLVVPWKYGFKSIKSIVKIEFTSEKPKTLWNELAPNEYGFYANVNPKVDHPRWSQASERIIDGSFFPKHKATLLFNGYEKEVAYLYKGMDLAKNY